MQPVAELGKWIVDGGIAHPIPGQAGTCLERFLRVLLADLNPDFCDPNSAYGDYNSAHGDYRLASVIGAALSNADGSNPRCPKCGAKTHRRETRVRQRR